MKLSKEHSSIVKDSIESLDYETRSYSGRGMYGKSCLAFVCDNPVKAALYLSLKVRSSLEDMCEEDPEVYSETVDYQMTDILSALEKVKTDSMGFDQVVYFPDIPYIDPDEYDEELEAERLFDLEKEEREADFNERK